MIEKFLNGSNNGLIAVLLAMLAAYGISEYSNNAKTAMKNGYDMSTKIMDKGEVRFSASLNSKQILEQEDNNLTLNKSDSIEEKGSDI